MQTSTRAFFASWLVGLGLSVPSAAATHPSLQQISPVGVTELRQWDVRVDRMIREGDLRVRSVVDDFAIPGRTHERADQYYKGVRVFGGDVARQIAGGQTLSIYGTIYSPVDVDVTPALTSADAVRRLKDLTGVETGEGQPPELTILPLEPGGYALVWKARVLSAQGLILYFLDARTGEVVKQIDDLKTQTSAVGHGRGVLGDEKKLSVQSGGIAPFMTIDMLRPPRIYSFDMKGNVQRMIDLLNGVSYPSMSDVATDSDDDWTDGATVDAHAYMGFTYDYYYKRFGRQGLDNKNRPMFAFVHPVRRQDLLTYPGWIVGTFYLNAFYAGGGLMVFGEGLPPGYVVGNTRQTVDYFAGALDVVAHELTHGVTDYTSALIYQGESGALNEAFSDMMATGAEFMFEPAGSGSQHADYVMGEDVIRPGGLRNLADPGAFGDPDHYSRRYTGPMDNGGVHINSTIAGHAFYLAIEGGTDRTSGLAVQGVGAANRDQVEKTFYRAFTAMLPSNATFSTARQATIQSARDLYGAGSPAERAVTQAWTAVGVQ